MERLQERHAPQEQHATPTLVAFMMGALLGGILGWVAGRGDGASSATSVALGCVIGVAAVALLRWVISNDALSEASDIDPGTRYKHNVGTHAPDSDAPLRPSPEVTRRAARRRHA